MLFLGDCCIVMIVGNKHVDKSLEGRMGSCDTVAGRSTQELNTFSKFSARILAFSGVAVFEL